MKLFFLFVYKIFVITQLHLWGVLAYINVSNEIYMTSEPII